MMADKMITFASVMERKTFKSRAGSLPVKECALVVDVETELFGKTRFLIRKLRFLLKEEN